MNKVLATSLGLAACMMCAVPAQAHFMMTYTPETYMQKAETADFRLVFMHPTEAGSVMDMGGIQEFYAMHKRGDNVKKTDLKKYLKEITWANPGSKAPGYAAAVPSKEIRSMGDHVFVLIPGYYLEKEEDIYMQQISKLILNVGGAPTSWNEPVGLPTEIVPMIKPYALWTGNIFQGQVLSDGKPVANAEIEVEFMSNMPNLKDNSMPKKSSVDYNNPSLVTQTIFADENGVFTFGIPKAGWWGFAALGVGPDTEHKGKGLSQDAVIWVQAQDIE